MTDQPLPLFFPEALQDIKVLSPRLRALGFTLADLAWLRNVELGTHAQRVAQTPPMTVENIMLKVGDTDAQPLVGSFMLHPTPGDHQAVLYTPYGGLRTFADRQTLLQTLSKTLKDATARVDVLRFLPIARREALSKDAPLTLTGQVIDGLVFDNQAEALKQSHRDNISTMRDQLNRLPTLTAMLNQLLNNELRSRFPGMDQSVTRVHYSPETAAVATSQTSTARSPLDPETLSDALLRLYLHQTWPSVQVRQFSNPQQASSTQNPVHQQQWEQALQKISGDLPAMLEGLLQTYWATDVSPAVSRRQFFSRALGDKARMDLLLKRQNAIISPEQSQTITALLDHPNSSSPAQMQKIRLWEHRENFVELAASLMLSNQSMACLYTQPAGWQVLKNSADIKQALSSMATARGHEDALYSLLTLRERDVFLGFDQPQVSGQSITGAVFEGMVDDIIAKQKDNITYALQTCRNTAGAFDIQSLFDQALDVRSLLDSSLLEATVSQRWGTRSIASGAQRPSIVLAVQAALATKKIQSAQASLDRKFAADTSTSAEQQGTFLASIKPQLAHAMSVGIRDEARLRMLEKTLQADEKAIVDTVLNPDKPTRVQRNTLNGFRPDAWSLTLECPDNKDLIPLANCFLLTERGGLDTALSGRAILWTPGAGLECFDCLDRVKDQLKQRLLDPQQRLLLLENVPCSQYRPHRAYTLGAFRLIERNVLHDRQQSAIEQYLEARKHTLSLNLPATSVQSDLERHRRAPTALNLDRATQLAQAIITRQALPLWLGTAANHDLQHHVELLEQLRHSIAEGKDYLHGISPLSDYVRQRLQPLLQARFPGAALDPDQLWVTPDPTLAIPAQSLTDFALNPTHVVLETDFSITSSTAQSRPTDLTASEVRKLLLQLDIKTAYRQLLTDTLANASTQMTTRQQRFFRQVPWQLLLHAHALKLQGNLSERGFNLVQQVLDMPDGVARATVAGANAIIRPVELIATEGAAVVKVPGMYLIGEAARGPQILYAPYDEQLGITEYTDEAAFVDALNLPGALQDLVIRRLPDPYKATYRNLLANSRDTDIHLACNLIEGNLLHQLFIDNHALLSQMLDSQSQRNEQADWETLKAVFGKGVRYAIRFLPGKLAIPVLLWQSFSSFKESAEALQDHHWKSALHTFINGVTQLVMLGKLLPEPGETRIDPNSPAGGEVDVTAPARTRLQPFEATSVELCQSGTPAADGTWLDTASQHHYAPIQGKVYRIDQRAAAPRIVNAERHGPYVRNSGTQWTLDPDVHSVHDGKALSTLHNKHQTRATVRRVFNIEAQGMEAIRQLYPDKARQIVQALDLARFYAFNSLHNLAQLKTALGSSRLEVFFKEFFDVATVDAALLKKIKTTIVPLCQALVDPTLDQLDHKRFVVGTTCSCAEERVIAFVLSEDRQQRVHFTEYFFDQQLERYEGALTQSFDIVAHAQAATLIHEFSHLFSKTFDIATLESRRPFSDLISTLSLPDRLLKATQEQFQREALSMNTPVDELFAYWNRNWQTWEDIPATHKLHASIKTITGTDNMAEARKAFLDPISADRRIDTILRNADSVARLVCEMGRCLDPAPGN